MVPNKCSTPPKVVLSCRIVEFRDQDLSGALFLRTYLNGATFAAVDLTGAKFKGADFIDVEIAGDIRNCIVNGVDIAPLVEDELNRRMPERAKMRAKTSDEFREAWSILERLWGGTLERARSLPAEKLHESVNGEWSFIQTLRHLNFASAAWGERMILGVASPWHPLDLPWDEAPGWDGIPWDRDARPSLDEVLAVRRQRQESVRGVMASLTDEQLASDTGCTEPGWPSIEAVPVNRCLGIILNEEWEHRLYAERDLTALRG